MNANTPSQPGRSGGDEPRLIVVNLDPELNFSPLVRRAAIDLFRQRERIELWDGTFGKVDASQGVPGTTGQTDATPDVWGGWPRQIAGGVDGVIAEFIENLQDQTSGEIATTSPLTFVIIPPRAETGLWLSGAPQASVSNAATAAHNATLQGLDRRAKGQPPQIERFEDATFSRLARGLSKHFEQHERQRARTLCLVLAQGLWEQPRRALENLVGSTYATAFDAVLVWNPAEMGGEAAQDRLRDAFIVQCRLIIDMLSDAQVVQSLITHFSNKNIVNGPDARMLSFSTQPNNLETHRDRYLNDASSFFTALHQASSEERDEQDNKVFNDRIANLVEGAKSLAVKAENAVKGGSKRLALKDLVHLAADEGLERVKEQLKSKSASAKSYTPADRVDAEVLSLFRAFLTTLDETLGRRIEFGWSKFLSAETQAIDARRKELAQVELLKLTELGTGPAGYENYKTAKVAIEKQQERVLQDLNAFRALDLSVPKIPYDLPADMLNTTRWLVSVRRELELALAAMSQVIEACKELPEKPGLLGWTVIGMLAFISVPAMWAIWYATDPKATALLAAGTAMLWGIVFLVHLILPYRAMRRASAKVKARIAGLYDACDKLDNAIDGRLDELARYFGLAQQSQLLRRAREHLNSLEADRRRVVPLIEEVKRALSSKFQVGAYPTGAHPIDLGQRKAVAKSLQLDLKEWLPWALQHELALTNVPTACRFRIENGQQVAFPSTFFAAGIELHLQRLPHEPERMTTVGQQ